MANINFDEILYNVARKKIKSEENLKLLDSVVKVLQNDPNGDPDINKEQATLLYQFFRKTGISTNKIKLTNNSSLHDIVEKVLSSSLFTEPATNASTDNVRKYIIDYVQQNHTTDINVDNLYQVGPISDGDYNKFKVSVSNCHNLDGLLNLIFTNGFTETYKTLVNNKDNNDFQELQIPIKLYEAFLNPSIFQVFESEQLLDVYKTIYSSTDDKELATNMKVINSSIDDTQVPADSSILLDTFLNTKLNIKADNNNPLPQDVKDVKLFFATISSDAMNAQRSKVTLNVINKWNGQLADAYNTANAEKEDKKIFTDFNELKTDEDLKNFCIANWDNSGDPIKIDPDNSPEPGYVLNMVKAYKVRNDMTIEKYVSTALEKGNITVDMATKFKDVLHTVIKAMNNNPELFYNDYLIIQTDEALKNFYINDLGGNVQDLADMDTSNNTDAVLKIVNGYKLSGVQGDGTIITLCQLNLKDHKPVSKKFKESFKSIIEKALAEFKKKNEFADKNKKNKEKFVKFINLKTDKELDAFCKDTWKKETIELNIDQDSDKVSDILDKVFNKPVAGNLKAFDYFKELVENNETEFTVADRNKALGVLKTTIKKAALQKIKENSGMSKYQQLLTLKITINPDDNVTIDFASLLASLSLKENSIIFDKKVINVDGTELDYTNGDNLMKIMANTTVKQDYKLHLKESCPFSTFRDALGIIVNDKFNTLDLVNEFGNNTDIWEENKDNKSMSGFLAINTLYEIFTNPSILSNNVVRLFFITLWQNLNIK